MGNNIKVKCKYCGKSIYKNNAYLVKHGKSNWYYCNEEHSKLKTNRQLVKEKIDYIFGYKVVNNIMVKELNELYKAESDGKILAYLNENEDKLKKILFSKKFSSEYGQIKYFTAIIKNHIKDFKPKTQQIKADIFSIELVEKQKHKKRIQRRGLDEVLSDIGNS